MVILCRHGCRIFVKGCECCYSPSSSLPSQSMLSPLFSFNSPNPARDSSRPTSHLRCHTAVSSPLGSGVSWPPSSTRRRCLCGSVYTMQPLATWLACVCRLTLCVVASNCIPWRLGLCWSRVPGLLLVRAASLSMDHEHGTVCQPILEHQIRLCSFKRHLKAHLFQQ